MVVRAVDLSPRAERQLAAIEAYYLKEAGPAVAGRAVASNLAKCVHRLLDAAPFPSPQLGKPLDVTRARSE